MKIMLPSMYLFCLIAFVLVEARTEALQPKEGAPRRCFECNGAACEDPEEFADEETGKPVVVCPRDRPHCATRAAAPIFDVEWPVPVKHITEFISVLGCAAATETPCVLNKPNRDIFEIVCVCSTHLCNAPFSQDLRAEMIHLRNSSLNRSEVVPSLPHESDHADNTTQLALSYATGAPFDSAALLSTLNTVFSNNTHQLYDHYTGPRSGYLKRHTTLPSDDEEDDGEGSGTDMKPLFDSPSYAPSVSSDYAPEEDNNDNNNNAQTLMLNILAAIPLLMYFIV